MSNEPSRVFAVPMVSQTPDPDRKIRIAQAVEYPNRAWYCIASFIGFVSICHFTALIYRIWWRRSTQNSRTRGVISYQRLPAATVNAFRALAFRWTLPIGESYTLNLAEVFLTAAYTVIIFVWALVNSTSCLSSQINTSRSMFILQQHQQKESNTIPNIGQTLRGILLLHNCLS